MESNFLTDHASSRRIDEGPLLDHKDQKIKIEYESIGVVHSPYRNLKDIPNPPHYAKDTDNHQTL
jgi:hypothetical protein